MPKSPPKPPPRSAGPTRATSFDPVVARAFGQVIRSLRERSGVAQDAFALCAGIDRSYYGKLERGERQPALALLLRVADGLGVGGGEIVAAVEAQIRSGRSRGHKAS